jgi:hypothetical protein
MLVGRTMQLSLLFSPRVPLNELRRILALTAKEDWGWLSYPMGVLALVRVPLRGA